MQGRNHAKSSRRARFAKNMAALSVGVFVCVLLGEVVVRSLPRRLVPELDPVQPATILLGGMARLSSNPKLYYELVPGVAGVNSAGYRGPQYPERKPTGVKRIVGVGNSTLFATELAEKDGYLRRLEGLLNEAGDRTVQIVNLAVPGYNTHQELEMLRTRGLAFDPDLVILGYDHNDPHPILGRNRPPMSDDYGQNVFHSEFIRYLLRKFYSRPHFRFHRKVDGSITGGKGWERHFDALAEIAHTCQTRGIPVLVVAYDAMVHREDRATSRHYRLLHEPLVAFWTDHGYYVVDCYDLFQAYMREHGVDAMQSLWISVEPRDAHPNADGHDLIARAVFEAIRKHRLLD